VPENAIDLSKKYPIGIPRAGDGAISLPQRSGGKQGRLQGPWRLVAFTKW
jgi:hypothetical protein